MLWVIIFLSAALVLSVARCYGMCRFSRESDEMFKRMVRLQSDMVLLFDADLRVLQVFNPEIVGKSASGFKSKRTRVSDYLSPQTVQWLQECVQSGSGDVFRREHSLDNPDGVRHYELYCKHFHGKKYLCALQDITRIKEKELWIIQQQELQDAILDNIPFPLMLKDVDNDLQYVYWNRECDLQSGFNRREILGKTDRDIFGQERGTYYQEVDRQVIATGKPYRNAEQYMTGDGVMHDSIVFKNVLSHGDRRLLLVVRWETTDLVQAEKAVREANRINRLILDNTHTGFVFLNPDFVVQWENVSTHFDHFGDHFYRMNEQCFRSVKSLDQICPECTARQAIVTGEPVKSTVSFDNGANLEVLATAVYNEDSELQGVVLRLEDVTDRMQIAANLLRAKEEAEKAVQLKSAFIANMSHEIRTPLNAIAGFGGLLTETDDPQEKKTYINVIQDNIDLLLQLIHDIMDLSEIESDTMEFTTTDVELGALLQDIENRIQAKANLAAGVQVRSEGFPEVCVVQTDPERLTQLLDHLLANAIKFTQQGQITFGYRTCGDMMRFYVSDTGPGIPEGKQEVIFDRFVKLDHFRTGTGLGLPLCQMIVHKLGGEIGVDSEPGKGSSFWFTLPMQPAATLDAQAVN